MLTGTTRLFAATSSWWGTPVGMSTQSPAVKVVDVALLVDTQKATRAKPETQLRSTLPCWLVRKGWWADEGEARLTMCRSAVTRFHEVTLT